MPISRNPSKGTITSFPLRAMDVTPDDNVIYEGGLQIQATGAGDVTVQPYMGGNTITFTLPDGGWVPVVVARVLAAGTTATDLKGVY